MRDPPTSPEESGHGGHENARRKIEKDGRKKILKIKTMGKRKGVKYPCVWASH